MSVIVAIDTMGGDFGPSITIPGVSLAIERGVVDDKVQFLLFGNQNIVEKYLNKHSNLSGRCSVVNTEEVVENSTKPAFAVRMGKRTSLGCAVHYVSNGEADAVVSSGNTGAYMALSKIHLKTLYGIDRPAIPVIVPTIKGQAIVLDLGANIICSAENLLQFAVMGKALSHHLLGVENPSIGILNVGSEELKGNATVQLAYHKMMQIPSLNFYGFVEGDDIAKGTADVVVTDGFTGNVVLKSIEGTAKLIQRFLKEVLESSVLGRLGYAIAYKSFKKIKSKIDPRFYNGAVFLGLREIAVKSHGNSDKVGFANAIEVALNMIKSELNKQIEDDLIKVFSNERMICENDAVHDAVHDVIEI